MPGVVVDPAAGRSVLHAEGQQALCSGHLLEPGHGLLVAPGGVQLGHGALQTGKATGCGYPGCPQGQELRDLVGNGGTGEALAKERIAEHGSPVGRSRTGGPVPYVSKQGDRWIGAAHDAALEGQGHAHYGPTAVHLTEAPFITDAHVVVEGGVGAFGGHGRDWLDLYARGIHGNQEHGEALVPGYVGVRTGEQDHPVRHVRHGRPHLLAGDHPLVAVAHGLRGYGCDVRTVVGFAVAEAAVEAACEQFLEDPAAMEVGPHGVDHAGHQHRDRQAVVGRTSLLQLVEQEVELYGVAVAVAGDRPGQEAGIGQGSVEGLVVEGTGGVHLVDNFGGEVVGDEGLHLGTELDGPRTEREVHQRVAPDVRWSASGGLEVDGPASRRSARRRHSRAGSSRTTLRARARRKYSWMSYSSLKP